MTRYPDGRPTPQRREAAPRRAANRVRAMIGLLFLSTVPGQAQSGGAGLNPLAQAMRPLGSFAGKPLFSPSRRPPPPAPAAVAPVESVIDIAPPEFELVGIVRMADRTVGLVRAGQGDMQSLEVGDNLDGWDVAAIGSSTLDLRSGERQETLRLFDPGKPSSPPGANGGDRGDGSVPATPVRDAATRASLADIGGEELLKLLRRR